MEHKKKSWFDRLQDNLRDAFFATLNEDNSPRSVLASVYFDDDSFLEVELMRNNSLYVYPYHRDETVDRDCPNITSYLEDNLTDWCALMEEYEDADTAMDEWQQHGFRDEADYWRYRLG